MKITHIISLMAAILVGNSAWADTKSQHKPATTAHSSTHGAPPKVLTPSTTKATPATTPTTPSTPTPHQGGGFVPPQAQTPRTQGTKGTYSAYTDTGSEPMTFSTTAKADAVVGPAKAQPNFAIGAAIDADKP